MTTVSLIPWILKLLWYPLLLKLRNDCSILIKIFKNHFRNVWPSWFLTIGHVVVQIKIWSNVPIVKILANVLPVNVTSCSPNVFCSLRTVSNENIICSGQEEHQKDNLTWNEGANQLEIQMQLQTEPVVGIQMDQQFFLMTQSKNAAKIFL